MSLKGVELQIAIPKTFDAGKMQDQRQQAVLTQQLHATEEAKKDFEKQRTQVIESDHLDELRTDDEKSNQQQQQQKNKEDSQQKDVEKVKVQHPFKGNFFDISG